MTPKELRAAAEELDMRATSRVEETGLKRCDPHELDCMLLADHILATVREDDGEPADEEWGKAVSGESSKIQFWFDIWFMIATDKTRGQFRKLCEGLGTVLKENAQ